jgi:hemin uptake protein HemP
MQVQEISTSNMPVPRRFPTIDSNNLFAVSREVRINHEGEEYRLRITSNNKLILTK